MTDSSGITSAVAVAVVAVAVAGSGSGALAAADRDYVFARPDSRNNLRAFFSGGGRESGDGEGRPARPQRASGPAAAASEATGAV